MHYPELSTRRILVMQMVDGDTLSSPGTIESHPIEERRLQAVALFRSLMHQIMDDGVFHADLHPGNIVLQPDGRIMLLDFGSVGRLDADLRQLVSEVLLAFYRGDSRGIGDALLGMAELPGGIRRGSPAPGAQPLHVQAAWAPARRQGRGLHAAGGAAGQAPHLRAI